MIISASGGSILLRQPANGAGTDLTNLAAGLHALPIRHRPIVLYSGYPIVQQAVRIAGEEFANAALNQLGA